MAWQAEGRAALIVLNCLNGLRRRTYARGPSSPSGAVHSRGFPSEGSDEQTRRFPSRATEQGHAEIDEGPNPPRSLARRPRAAILRPPAMKGPRAGER